MYDVVIGRNKKNVEKYGTDGAIFIGKQYVEMGAVRSLSNKVYMDVSAAHVVFISGKRGGGKSYTLGVFAEGMATLPINFRENLSVILLDTMGIYWTMKYPNNQDAELLKEWGMNPKELNPKIYVPQGFYKKFKQEGIPVDYAFSVRPSDFTSDEWCTTFEIDDNSPAGVLIERIINRLKENEKYSLQDMVDEVNNDKKADDHTKNLVTSFFEKAQGWGLFSVEGTPIKDLAVGGQITVLDVSAYSTLSSGWEIKNLVVGLVAKKLFNERMIARKKEEFSIVDTSMHYFKKELNKKLEEPLVWLVLDECLPYSSFVSTDRGKMKIGDIIKNYSSSNKIKVLGYDQIKKKFDFYKIIKVYEKGKKEVIELKTETGRKLICTPDHKIFTRSGFKEAIKSNNIGIPLKYNYSCAKKLVQARLLGHIYGDGWLSRGKRRQVGFSGKKDKDDLNLIKKDLETLGFSSGKIYSRITKSKITCSTGKIVKVNGQSNSISASFKTFDYFANLGAPIGKKTDQFTKIPSWLMKASKEQKAEFLAALFGSDGNAPSQSKNSGGDFNPIRFTFYRMKDLEKEGIIYANQIKKMFKSLGINVSKISKRKGNMRLDKTESIRFDLTIAKNLKNTIKFLEIVGYRYCLKKENDAIKWLAYLKTKQQSLLERQQLRKKVIKLHKEKKWGKTKISKELNIPQHWARDWLYFNRGVKILPSFPSFTVWVKNKFKEGLLFETISSKKLKKPEPVYDISVDKVHNFVADGFLVHNCHEMLPKEGKTAATDALITILREGRQPGISIVLATQQPGKIHTDVMTQSDIVLSHRLTAQIDVKALEKITQSYMADSISVKLDLLPKIKGSAIVFDDMNEKVFPLQIRPRITWHGGSSPSLLLKKEKRFF